jgi:hypothetical protein
MKFILIVLLFNTTSQNSSSVAMQEFNNQKTCLAAKAEIEQASLSAGSSSSRSQLRTLCVPKE